MTPAEQRAWDERIHALKQIGVPMPARVELAGLPIAAPLRWAARLDESNQES